MLLPPYGICLPVGYRRVEDARTVTMMVAGEDGLRDQFLIVLGSCEPLPGHQAAAIDAADQALSSADRLSLWLPLPALPGRVLRAIGHRPLTGEIFLGSERTLTQHLCRLGHAQRRAPCAP